MELKNIAREARLKVLDLIYLAQTSHIGSNFSAIDIMAVLFSKIDLDKDKFILSAGWKAASLYYFLWKKGRITEEQLNSYCQGDSPFIGLAEPVHPDIPFAGGSMGMGISAGVGFALAKKIKGEKGKVYVLESDGGIQEGSNWEAIAIAGQHKLDNLVVIVDRNWRQGMGKTEDILSQSNLMERMRAFGWDSFLIDGHNYTEIDNGLDAVPRSPLCIVADTVKGKGVSFMEGDNLYHYKAPNEDEYNKAKKELCQK